VPSEVGRRDHQPTLAIQRPGAADADAQKCVARDACLGDRPGDRGFDHLRDTLHDGVRAAVGERRLRVQRELAAPVRRHGADGDLGAAEVHSDNESCARHGSVKLFNARDTCSTSSSRMHFQWPSGQVTGPCESHGRQSSDSLPTVA